MNPSLLSFPALHALCGIGQYLKPSPLDRIAARRASPVGSLVDPRKGRFNRVKKLALAIDHEDRLHRADGLVGRVADRRDLRFHRIGQCVDFANGFVSHPLEERPEVAQLLLLDLDVWNGPGGLLYGYPSPICP